VGALAFDELPVESLAFLHKVLGCHDHVDRLLDRRNKCRCRCSGGRPLILQSRRIPHCVTSEFARPARWWPRSHGWSAAAPDSARTRSRSTSVAGGADPGAAGVRSEQPPSPIPAQDAAERFVVREQRSALRTADRRHMRARHLRPGGRAGGGQWRGAGQISTTPGVTAPP
jgi:hypothetical protein